MYAHVCLTYVCFTCVIFKVDGGWSDIMYGPYSASCGRVTVDTFRTCTNPRPRYGGKECVGETNQTLTKTLEKCPGIYYFSMVQRFNCFDNI